MAKHDPQGWAQLTDEQRAEEQAAVAEAQERAAELIDAFFVARATGLLPWEAGREVSRSRFYVTAAILAPKLTMRPLNLQRDAFEFEIEKLKNGAACPLRG